MKCSFCKKKIALIHCKWCTNLFCTQCQLPEIHSCNQQEKVLESAKKILEIDLMKNKVIPKKPGIL